MGLLDFLKISVSKGKTVAKPKRANNAIEVDGKRFPLAAITEKGFVADQFDGSLVKGQNARLTVQVDDEFAKLSFATTVLVTETKDRRLVAAWNLLTPELTDTLRKYGQRKKRAAAK